MFADDTKIFNIIKSPEDQEILQNDLDSLSVWSDKWLLKFHPEKCKVMHLGKADNTKYFYKLKEGDTHHELAYTEEEKDLGVVIDGKLDFEKHINININKACGIMAVIRRSFVSLNGVNFVPLYKSLVRSHLEYASCIWSPYNKNHIEAVERVQRRATKQLPGMKDLPYPERLKILKLPTLVYRRARGDMIETFKLLHDKYYGEYSQLVKLHASHISREGTRGHRFKLCQEGSKLNIRRQSFPVRITKVWNELPDSVVNAPNVNTFKNRLDRHAHRDVFQASLISQEMVKLNKGSIFIIMETEFAIQGQVMKQPNCTERLHVDATIMRSFQTELFSRFLPSLYASHVNLNAARHCRWVLQLRDGSAVEFIIFLVYTFVSVVSCQIL